MNATSPSTETANIADTTWGSIQELLNLVTDRTPVRLADPDLVKIVRLRLIGYAPREGYTWWDLGYCYGQMADGSIRRVTLDRERFGGRSFRRELVELFRESGRFGKGMGLFDMDVISTLEG